MSLMPAPAFSHPKKEKSFVHLKEVSITERFLLKASFTVFIIVALLGVWLRAWPFLPQSPVSYKNLVHGHSHFAFGGWLMPVLTLLLMRVFPDLRDKIHPRHWRNISRLFIFSAFGMLASFPFQGYGAVSITFSTLSVITNFYLIAVLWKQLKRPRTASQKFLKAGLFYLGLSALGPFATGPLIAMGYTGSPVYFNSIYFYLHLQLNGWFSFAVLAMLYRFLENRRCAANGREVFTAFNLACMPAFFLSVLWTNPHPVFYAIGGLAALVQLYGLTRLAVDLRKAELHKMRLLRIALIAFVIKLVLQVLSAFPYFASFAYAHKDLIIAYLHLVLLGFVSVFVLAAIDRSFHFMEERAGRWGFKLFLLAFTVTEFMLVAYGLELWGGVVFRAWLLSFSAMIPVGIALIFLGIRKRVGYGQEHTKYGI